MSSLRSAGRSVVKEQLTEIGTPAGVVSDVVALAAWYSQWRALPGEEKQPVQVALTEEEWENFLDNYDPETPASVAVAVRKEQREE